MKLLHWRSALCAHNKIGTHCNMALPKLYKNLISQLVKQIIINYQNTSNRKTKQIVVTDLFDAFSIKYIPAY